MNDNLMHNRTFDELDIGETASSETIANRDDIQLFAAMSGDVNPAHMDAAFAAQDMFGHIIIQGMWTAGLVSALLGTKMPGPGTIYLDQTLAFRHPVTPGDVITTTVTVKEKRTEKRIVLLDTICTNQSGDKVLTGLATVIAPADPIVWPRMPRPDVSVRRHNRYEAFVQEARAHAALRTAVVYPCTVDTIVAALEARDAGLLLPILVGPETQIRAAARLANVNLDDIVIEATENSQAAAVRAVELAASGKVEALMKGSLETAELLAAVVDPAGNLTTHRRISHVYLMDIPAYPKPLIVTDAAVNIAPTLEQKRDICQNAIDLLHLLGVAQPKVAVLAAVETVNSRMRTTLDAAALTVMSTRGQIHGASVDGPLAFDNAISLIAAKTKGIDSPVAGEADILLVPDLEAGNMLAKQLIYFAGADAAGLVLGARVPIIVTSRADSLRVRLASTALAKLVHERHQGGAVLP